jgi:hypothetical protein
MLYVQLREYLVGGNSSTGALGGPIQIGCGARASGDNAVSAIFNSRTFGTASRRPLLTLNAVAVPEPATWALGLCAGLSLAVTALRVGRRV